MRRRVTTMAAIVVSTMVAACDHDGGPEQLDFLAAARRWEANGPADYRFEYVKSCYCLGALRPLVIEVRAGVVEGATYSETDEEVPAERLAEVPTIDDLFAWIAEAIEEDADEIEATYDDEFGYPHEVSIDYIRQAIDDEVSFSVLGFEPLGVGE